MIAVTKKRIVFLVDMNAFYIACEMSRNNVLKDVPAAVAGDPQKRTGIILAANYQARDFGIKTAMTLSEALNKCPALVIVPPDHSYYSQRSKEVMNHLSHYTPAIEQNSIDEAWLDMTGTEKLFGTPHQTAQRIMEELKKELDLWCSIGISDNKFLAKMAADMQKPLGITELWSWDVSTKLWPLPAQAMYGIGKKTMEKLKQLKISTIRDLAQCSPADLVHHLGSHGIDLHQKANGIDTSDVVAHLKEDMKSIGRSTTLAEDAYNVESVRDVFLALAEDVGMQARKYSKKGTTIQIILKFNDFNVITRQITVAPTCYTKDLFDAGLHLLKKHWPSSRGVRLIGISLTGFNPQEDGKQMSIFDAMEDTSPGNQEDKVYIIDEVMDRIRKKHGSKTISRASLLRKNR